MKNNTAIHNKKSKRKETEETAPIRKTAQILTFSFFTSLLLILFISGCKQAPQEPPIKGPFCEDLGGVCKEACDTGYQPSLLDCKDATLQCCITRPIIGEGKELQQDNTSR
ncbi:hypothetical protein D6783_03980 [Candidatus Woesearchaeota archaeon]|nr:MAG: hypothetical protein D6783_03980 [Candidatus Woesearchaeota archaeon]